MHFFLPWWTFFCLSISTYRPLGIGMVNFFLLQYASAAKRIVSFRRLHMSCTELLGTFANNAMGIIKSNTITYRIISVISMFGNIACLNVFYPIYTLQILGHDMENQDLTKVYLKPPSNGASCIILCGLTAGCLWATFNSNTGICSMSNSVCLQSAENQETSFFAVVHNLVCMNQ